MAGTAEGKGRKVGAQGARFVGLRVPRFATAQHGGHKRNLLIPISIRANHTLGVMPATSLNEPGHELQVF